MKRPTLSEVASAARVSTSTASKVLNNRPDVAPETRKRVEAVLNDVGYQPTTGRREIRRGPVVAVLFDSLLNPYSTQVLRGILSAAKEMQVDIVVEVITNGPGEVFDDVGGGGNRPLSVSWLRVAAQKGWVGLLVVTTEVSLAVARHVRDAGLFLVAVDAPNALDESIVSVRSTNFTGAIQATNHLLELGHRHIGVAGGPRSSLVADERLRGYRSAMQAAGIAPDDDLILRGAFDYDAGVGMCLTLLGRRRPPTAILTGSDATALGVLEGARRLDVNIPRDLSVVGFDDTPAAVSSAPPLTTVRQPMIGLGQTALRTLLAHSRGDVPDSHRIQLATSLVVRESTSTPRTQIGSPAVVAINSTRRDVRA